MGCSTWPTRAIIGSARMLGRRNRRLWKEGLKPHRTPSGVESGEPSWAQPMRAQNDGCCEPANPIISIMLCSQHIPCTSNIWCSFCCCVTLAQVTLATGEYYQAEENRTSSGASTDTVRRVIDVFELLQETSWSKTDCAGMCPSPLIASIAPREALY